MPDEKQTLKERASGGDTMANENDAGAILSWRVVAVGACSFILTGGSYLIGDTLSTLRADLKEVRTILDQRASVPTRLESIERQTDDQERRLRNLEERSWRNGLK